jgi:hypothetical protein
MEIQNKIRREPPGVDLPRKKSTIQIDKRENSNEALLGILRDL